MHRACAALMLLYMVSACTALAPRASFFFQIYNITNETARNTTNTHFFRALYGR